MSWTLAFDTSASHCAAAILKDDGELIVQIYEEMHKGQAERLMPLLEGLLSRENISWQDLSRIGVGVGPGNFTGIRLSVSAARGLALGLGIPAIGVSSLEAQVFGVPGMAHSVIDARQNRLYQQTFQDGAPVTEPAIIAAADIPDGHCVGFGLAQPMLPMAEAIARIAAMRPPIDRPVPLYLRPADAAPSKDPAPVIL